MVPECRLELANEELANEELTGGVIQDVVLLNKVDLVTGGTAEVEDLEAQIHKINALVKIVRSERCRVDLKDVFERRAYKVQVLSNHVHSFNYH